MARFYHPCLSAESRHVCSGLQLTSGSGRTWQSTTLLVVPFPVSRWNGVRGQSRLALATVVQSTRDLGCRVVCLNESFSSSGLGNDGACGIDGCLAAPVLDRGFWITPSNKLFQCQQHFGSRGN